MFTIIIQEKGGEQRRMVFNKPEVTIGRVQGNDIVLPKGNVSKRHARIVLKDGKFIIVDLKSTNGTYVNGRKITSPLVVKDSDKIYVGDFIIGVDEASASEGDGPSETTTSPPGPEMRPPPVENRPPRPTEAVAMPNNFGSGPQNRMEAEPAPPPPQPPAPAPIPRPGPPRPAPTPTREPPMAREPAPPPADPGPRIPPLGGPVPRPGGRPGGTMPPPNLAPIAPLPPPIAPAPMQTQAEPAPIPPPMQRQPAYEPPPPAPAPMPMPMPAQQMAPAPVPMQMQQQSNGSNGAQAGAQKRALVGAGAKRIAGRSMSSPSRRGVHLEALDPKLQKMLDLQSTILDRLRTKLDLDKVPMDRLHEEDLWTRAENATVSLIETLETSGELPKYVDQNTLLKETLNEALALGPLEDLFADDKIDEIIIDRRDRVIVGKDGQLRGSGKAFSSDDVFERVVKRLVAEAGGVIDETRPMVDLRMRDGTRLTAAVSPVASRGACLVLKKPPAQMPQLSDLVNMNTMSAGMADFLATCVAARRNILVCGGPGSGKATVVAAIAAAAPAGERVVSLEEVGELAIARDEWIQLETRPPHGKAGEIDMASLFDTAMRLMPDRLVIGEIKGREAMPVISALCSSVDGAIVAMSGEGASPTLNRLAALARISAPMGVDGAIRELVGQAIEIVVHVVRFADGSIRVHAIEEVTGVSEVGFDSQILFQFANGQHGATGMVPRFYGELEARGIPADQAVFR
jgi:pilus assembly protein CpaF